MEPSHVDMATGTPRPFVPKGHATSSFQLYAFTVTSGIRATLKLVSFAFRMAYEP